MRTIIDLPEDQVKALDIIGKNTDQSRAALVREAVTQYLTVRQQDAKGKLDQYFGVFKDDPTAWDGLDGLGWQKKMRAEWAERDAAIDERLAENRGMHDKKQSDYQSK